MIRFEGYVVFILCVECVLVVLILLYGTIVCASDLQAGVKRYSHDIPLSKAFTPPYFLNSLGLHP